jgi:hypothetical protein
MQMARSEGAQRKVTWKLNAHLDQKGRWQWERKGAKLIAIKEVKSIRLEAYLIVISSGGKGRSQERQGGEKQSQGKKGSWKQQV